MLYGKLKPSFHPTQRKKRIDTASVLSLRFGLWMACVSYTSCIALYYV